PPTIMFRGLRRYRAAFAVTSPALPPRLPQGWCVPLQRWREGAWPDRPSPPVLPTYAGARRAVPPGNARKASARPASAPRQACLQAARRPLRARPEAIAPSGSARSEQDERGAGKADDGSGDVPLVGAQAL